MTSPNLTNVVWVKTIFYSYRHIRPKKVKYPIPEIPDDSEKKSGTDSVLPKNIGSVWVSGTRQALSVMLFSTPSGPLQLLLAVHQYWSTEATIKKAGKATSGGGG